MELKGEKTMWDGKKKWSPLYVSNFVCAYFSEFEGYENIKRNDS